MISRTPIPNFKKKFDVVSVFIDHGGETLLLLRQDGKPQGNMWAMLGGKVDPGEELNEAIAREVFEEIGLSTSPTDYTHFESYYIRYPEYDFMYHVFHLPAGRHGLPQKEKPILQVNAAEHKDFKWIRPADALKLKLIQDEDSCIKWFYNI
jgi:8-oxo-dGTP diphosphatase